MTAHGPVPAELIQLIQPLLLAYFRLQGALLILPAFSERLVPVRVKVALAMALAPAFAEFFDSSQQLAPSLTASFLLRCIGELLLGGLIAAPARIISFALHVASSAIASTASLSQLVGTGTEAAPHPIGNLYHLAGMALLMAMGLPLRFLELMAQGYLLFPGGRPPQLDNILPGLAGLFATSFTVAMTMASPFILGGLLYQLLGGIVNRVMPALPVVFIGAPAIIMLALVGLAALSPAILSLWSDAVLGAGLR